MFLEGNCWSLEVLLTDSLLQLGFRLFLIDCYWIGHHIQIGLRSLGGESPVSEKLLMWTSTVCFEMWLCYFGFNSLDI